MKRKSKKVKRMRGSKTHGGGNMRRRGAGNRGGRGNAGTGKRADHKKGTIDAKSYFGRHGFKSIKKVKSSSKDSLNLDDLQRKLFSLLDKKLVEEKSGAYHIDLTKLGYEKLLGSGSVKNKFILKVKSASKKAVEKIEKAGGKIELEIKSAEKVIEKPKE